MKTTAAKSNVVALPVPSKDAPRPNMKCMCCGEPLRSEKSFFANGHERRAEGFIIHALWGSTAAFVHAHRHLLPKDGLKSVKEAEIVRKQERAAERERKAAETEVAEAMLVAEQKQKAEKARKTVSEKISEDLEKTAPKSEAVPLKKGMKKKVAAKTATKTVKTAKKTRR